MYPKFLPFLCCLKACFGIVSGGMDPARIRGMQSDFPGENVTIGGQPREGREARGGRRVVDARSLLPAY